MIDFDDLETWNASQASFKDWNALSKKLDLHSLPIHPIKASICKPGIARHKLRSIGCGLLGQDWIVPAAGSYLLVNVDRTDGKDPSFFDSWDIFHLISVWAIFNSKCSLSGGNGIQHWILTVILTGGSLKNAQQAWGRMKWWNVAQSQMSSWCLYLGFPCWERRVPGEYVPY